MLAEVRDIAALSQCCPKVLAGVGPGKCRQRWCSSWLRSGYWGGWLCHRWRCLPRQSGSIRRKRKWQRNARRKK